MPWITVMTPNQQHHSFDFDDNEQADKAYNVIIDLVQNNVQGYIQLPTSKTSVMLFPAEVLRQCVFQIGGING